MALSEQQTKRTSSAVSRKEFPHYKLFFRHRSNENEWIVLESEFPEQLLTRGTCSTGPHPRTSDSTCKMQDGRGVMTCLWLSTRRKISSLIDPFVARHRGVQRHCQNATRLHFEKKLISPHLPVREIPPCWWKVCKTMHMKCLSLTITRMWGNLVCLDFNVHNCLTGVRRFTGRVCNTNWKRRWRTHWLFASVATSPPAFLLATRQRNASTLATN